MTPRSTFAVRVPQLLEHVMIVKMRIDVRPPSFGLSRRAMRQ